ncbi:MAG: hypothetical protein WCA59_03100 [Candidatus Binataceae bacterium]
MAEKSIQKLESDAVVLLQKELGEPLSIAVRVLNLISALHAVETSGKLPLSQIVRLLLLQRIQNDLRCGIILAERGYPFQALGHAASIFEGWVTIAAIQNEERAKEWLSHKDETFSFGRIRPLTQQALEHILGNADDTAKLYSQYQQVCMAKHLNPILERSRGYKVEGKTIHFRPGPDVDPIAIGYAWYAVERSSRFAFFASLAFIQNDPTPLPSDLRRRAEALRVALDELQAKSVGRWPDSYTAETSS